MGKDKACDECSERRAGMDDLLLMVGGLVNQVACLPDMTEKVNWTYNQLKGNGKTTLEGFREEDKEHRNNLIETNKIMSQGFTALSEKIDTSIAPVRKKADKNERKIFKITVSIITVSVIIMGVITGGIKLISFIREIQSINVSFLEEVINILFSIA